MPDSKIDDSDIPALRSFPPEVHVGRFYRPVKEQISLRVDADVLAWFRSRGKKYQTYMNEVLRREMQGCRVRLRTRSDKELPVLDAPDDLPMITSRQIRALEADRGVLRSPRNPETERALKVAREVASKHRSALRGLVK